MRNAFLLVATVLVFGGAFAAYMFLVDDPESKRSDTAGVLDALPGPQPAGQDAAIEIGPVQIPPGEAFGFTVYDEKTGEATSRVEARDWRKVEGTTNEFVVRSPHIAMRMPSGMVAIVSGEQGHLVVDRQRGGMKPRSGTLQGAVQIIIDRRQKSAEAPAAEQSAERITVSADDLAYDLERGTLQTDGPISVVGAEFEVAGRGLDLAWNQAANRVERLRLEKGERLVLSNVDGGVGDVFGVGSRGGTPQEQPAGKPPAVGAPASGAAGKREPGVAYLCTLLGNVAAEHFAGEQSRGRIEADEVRITFDLGGGGNALFEPAPPASQPATAAAPATTSQPAEPLPQKLIVHWNGPLTLEPLGQPPEGQRRRRFDAVGDVVRLTSPKGSVECGRLEYFDDTRQIWLHAVEGGVVTFGRGEEITATAQSVYVDRRANLVKLVGEVALHSMRGPENARKRTSIRCSLWAELRADDEAAVEVAGEIGSAVDLGALSNARFVGDVVVDMGADTLRANSLDARFRSGAQSEDPQGQLKSAVATGDVVLESRDRAIRCGQLDLTFDLTAGGDVYPSVAKAVGSAVVEQGRARVSGSRIHAELVPLEAADGAARNAEIALRFLRIEGSAELFDPDSRVAARGEQIEADFAGRSQPVRAVITAPGSRARLRAGDFIIRGERIELDQIDVSADALTLHVGGPSELRFRSQRGLQGTTQGSAQVVTVTCRDSLLIDGARNTVLLSGMVQAGSGNEQLRADKITLLLAAVEEEAVQPPPTPAWEIGWDALRNTILPGAEDSAADAFSFGTEERGRRVRRDLVRLLADNAIVESVEPGAAGDRPRVESSIAAPLLEVDFPNRLVRTTGETTLYMANRQLETADAARGAVGLPSALITRGPSQTAMKCDTAMTYALGTEGPDRRDKVLFEGGVVFVHVAGKEMVNPLEMFPEAANAATLLEELKSRRSTLQSDRLECEFAAGRAGRAGAQPTGLGAGMQLTWLIATGDVYLRDLEQANVREVFADWVEFDRERSVIRVRGSATADARIYTQNTARGTFDNPVVGRELEIDLKNNTVRGQGLRGGTIRP